MSRLGGSNSNGEETRNELRNILARLALMGGLIVDHRRVKRQGVQDAGAITEAATMKMDEAGIARGIFREICEIPDKPSGVELGRSKKLKAGRELMAKLNSAGQIDHLLRCVSKCSRRSAIFLSLEVGKLRGGRGPGYKSRNSERRNLQQIRDDSGK